VLGGLWSPLEEAGKLLDKPPGHFGRGQGKKAIGQLEEAVRDRVLTDAEVRPVINALKSGPDTETTHVKIHAQVADVPQLAPWSSSLFYFHGQAVGGACGSGNSAQWRLDADFEWNRKKQSEQEGPAQQPALLGATARRCDCQALRAVH
jgi:hypothetical protein